MTALVLWKALFDQACYYTFFGFLAAAFGAGTTPLFLTGCLTAACAPLAWRLRDRGRLSLLPFALPLLALVLVRGGLLGTVAALPGLALGLWEAKEGNLLPSHDRQAELFDLYWKGLLGLAALGILFGQVEALTALALPWGCLGVGSSVLLTRSLRHDPEVYEDRALRLHDLLAVAALLVCAALLSSKPFLAACGGVLKGIYGLLLAPALEILLWCIGGVIYAVLWLLSRFIRPGEKDTTTDMPDFGAGMDQFQQLQQPGEGSSIWRGVLALLALIAIIVGLILLFRRLLRRGRQQAARQRAGEYRTYAPPRQAHAQEEPVGSVQRRVRHQYRRFLRLYVDAGLPLQPSDTSGDVERKSGGDFAPGPAQELRQLYLNARYGGQTGPADPQRAKELVGKLKKDR